MQNTLLIIATIVAVILLPHTTGKTIELGGDSKARVLAYDTIWVKC